MKKRVLPFVVIAIIATGIIYATSGKDQLVSKAVLEQKEIIDSSYANMGVLDDSIMYGHFTNVSECMLPPNKHLKYSEKQLAVATAWQNMLGNVASMDEFLYFHFHYQDISIDTSCSESDATVLKNQFQAFSVQSGTRKATYANAFYKEAHEFVKGQLISNIKYVPSEYESGKEEASQLATTKKPLSDYTAQEIAKIYVVGVYDLYDLDYFWEESEVKKAVSKLRNVGDPFYTELADDMAYALISEEPLVQ